MSYILHHAIVSFQDVLLQVQGLTLDAHIAVVKENIKKILDKMVYLDRRCFLPDTDVLREDDNFSNKKAVSQLHQFKTMEFVDEAIKKVHSAKTKPEQKSVLQEVGCKGPYSLRKLPSYDRFLSTPVEPMHAIQNV